MKKLLLSASMLCFGMAMQAQCTPQATLNENFSSFTPGFTALPQNCWGKITTGPVLYITNPQDNPQDIYAAFYSSNSADTDGYIVTPELSTIDGNHKLTFDAKKITSGIVTLQVGTLSSPDDASTFVAVTDVITLTSEVAVMDAIVIPASSTQKYIAFKFKANAIHNAATLDNVVWEEMETEEPGECAAVETLDENFNAFTKGQSGTIPQNCWTANAGIPLFYVWGNDASTENFVTFYNANSANTPGYLVSPELSTIDGSHNLSFDTFKVGNPQFADGFVPGNMTVQVGTLSNPTDFASMQPVGEPIVITEQSVTHSNIIIPASATQKYIVFKINADAIHNAAGIDNVIWKANTAGVVNAAKNTFSIYPNPAEGKIITINNTFAGNTAVAIYALTGAKVYDAALTNNEQTLNLSNLSSGMYIVKVSTGNTSESKKLILK